MGKTKWIELRFRLGRVTENLEIQKIEIVPMSSKKGGLITPKHNKFSRGANKGEVSFRVPKGAYFCKIEAKMKGKDQKINSELILNERDYSWKDLPPVFDSCYDISFYTVSSH